MLDQVEATPDTIRDSLFPADVTPVAHCVIGELDGEPAGFALYFYNFSTFVGRPGLYLEDCTSRRRAGATDLGRPCCCTWRSWRTSADADGWNGPSSTGTRRRSRSTNRWVRGVCGSGRYCRLTSADLARLVESSEAQS